MAQINQNISGQIKKIIGNFEYELIYKNNFEKNFVYLLKTDNNKYILKVKNNSKNPKEELKQEISSRKQLKKVFNQGKIKNCIITKVIDYDAENLWVLFEFYKFKTLYDIYKENKNKFRKIIINLYSEVIIPLLKNIDIDTIVPGEFGVNDIGYSDEKFYFFDLEANKVMIRAVVDMYSKLVHLYLKAEKKSHVKSLKFLENLISEIKKNQQPYIDKNIYNDYFKKRLKSSTLMQALDKNDLQNIYDKFRY